MKPSFALNLTSDSIGLLQRTEGGWQDIGSVPFDSPDLPAALGTLRGKAGPGLTSKIVLPDSQILYTEVVAPGPDTGARRTQIRAALEGLTPYAVRELVFDWHGSGDRVKVAVIARETLQEAEAFAEEHGFNPLSFVAAPSPEKFGKEPWFGTTAGAQKRLPKGEKVERDLEALVLAGAAPEEEAALREAAEPLAHPVPEVVEPEIPGSELPEAVAEELPPSEAEAAPESAEPLAHPLPETVEPEIPGSELPEEPELQAEAPEAVEHDDAPEAVEPVTEAEAPQPETPEVIAERFTDVILPAEAEPVAAEEMSEPERTPEDEPDDAPLPATPE
ncbi:translation initiation factor 2, partial [Cereibacter changlensis]